MVAQLKEIYSANTIASCIFFVGGTQALMAPVIANAALYCTDSILFENEAL